MTVLIQLTSYVLVKMLTGRLSKKIISGNGTNYLIIKDNSTNSEWVNYQTSGHMCPKYKNSTRDPTY